MHSLGRTRSANRRDHLLHTPDTFVRTVLPGMERGAAVVHISPAAGAAFTQYTAELESGGTLGPTSAERFVYVLAGAVDLATGTSFQSIDPGGYAYLPEGLAHTLTAQSATRLAVIERPYQPLAGVAAPHLLVGNEDAVISPPLRGSSDPLVRTRLPEAPAFDFGFVANEQM